MSLCVVDMYEQRKNKAKILKQGRYLIRNLRKNYSVLEGKNIQNLNTRSLLLDLSYMLLSTLYIYCDMGVDWTGHYLMDEYVVLSHEVLVNRGVLNSYKVNSWASDYNVLLAIAESFSELYPELYTQLFVAVRNNIKRLKGPRNSEYEKLLVNLVVGSI